MTDVCLAVGKLELQWYVRRSGQQSSHCECGVAWKDGNFFKELQLPEKYSCLYPNWSIGSVLNYENREQQNCMIKSSNSQFKLSEYKTTVSQTSLYCLTVQICAICHPPSSIWPLLVTLHLLSRGIHSFGATLLISEGSAPIHSCINVGPGTGLGLSVTEQDPSLCLAIWKVELNLSRSWVRPSGDPLTPPQVWAVES